MEYLLMLYVKEGDWPNLSPEEQERGMTAYMAYTNALTAAGLLKASSRLRPSLAATTVRNIGGRVQVLDGPFADSKEQLGGFFLIEAPDLDVALSWAARCPATEHGVVEVRPLWDTPRQIQIEERRENAE